MSASRLLSTINHYRTLLAQQEDSAEAALREAHASTLAEIQPALDRLYDQMVEKMAGGEKIPLSWLYEAQRLETITKLISGKINQFGALALAQVARLQQVGVHLGQQGGLALLRTTVPPGVSWSFGIPLVSAIERLIGATRAGSPLADLFHGFGAEAAKKVTQTLVTGITLGHNPRKIASQVSTALDISRHRALTISRTELNRAYRDAGIETYKANSDVVSQYRRTCAKDGRTCAACLALDGTLCDLDKEFAIHPCDRCAAVPVTKDWSEILADVPGIDTSKIPDTRPHIETGSEWLAKQSEDVQRQVFGSNAAYQLYKSGTPLADFVQHSHDEEWGPSIQQKSVKQLAKAGAK